MQPEQSRIILFSENDLCVRRGMGNTLWFRRLNTSLWTPRFGEHYMLEETSSGFSLFDMSSGVEERFHGMDTATPGVLAKIIQPDGTSSLEMVYDGAGRLLIVRATGVGRSAEGSFFQYVYGPNGLLHHVVFSNTSGSRCVHYSYHETDGPNGRSGDLKTVKIFDGDSDSAPLIRRTYYRYHGTSHWDTFSHALRYVLESASWDRMEADGFPNPDSVPDNLLEQYADRHVEYDARRRVILDAYHGGAEVFVYDYGRSDFPRDHNNWATRTRVFHPDGQMETVYTNGYYQTMLRVFAGSRKAYVYDENGNVAYEAENSAVESVDERSPALFRLRANAGLIKENVWTRLVGKSAWLLATYVRNGAAPGAVRIQVSRLAWHLLPLGTWRKRVFLGSRTQYRDDAGGGSNPATTFFEDFPHPGASQPLQRVTTFPPVSTSENGTGEPAVKTEIFDTLGRLIWKRDTRGVITRHTYSAETGALSQTIEDVDVTKVNGAPDGWVTPAGAGLHLITDFEADFLGRETLRLGPVHTAIVDGIPTQVRTANHTIYRDSSHETWSAKGYVTNANGNDVHTTLSPVQIRKTDSSGNLTDDISAIHVGGGRITKDTPDFPQSTWCAWSRKIHNDAMQVVEERDYFSIPASGDGIEGENYNSTRHTYDEMNRRTCTQSPGGTLEKTVFDALGRVVENWIGTNDGRENSNMVRISANEYDNDGDNGDDRLTKNTRFDSLPGSSEVTEAITTRTYDWRKRQIAEINPHGTRTQRTHDNLDRVTTEKIFSTTGELLARRDTHYDARGRIHRETIHGVSNGTTGNTIATDTWFDTEGNTIKHREAGQRIWTKQVFDALNRAIKTYICHPANGMDDGATNNVEGDIVVEQTTHEFDAASTAIASHRYLRFHNDTTTTGDLLPQFASATPNARAYHVFQYADAANRPIASADFGTNGGAATTRPDTIPQSGGNVRVSTQTYDPQTGTQTDTTNPLGIITHREYDALSRLILQIENHIPGAAPNPGVSRITQYTYAPDGGISTLTLQNPDTGAQTTLWQYGTTLAESAIATSHLLRQTIYPDDGPDTPDRVQLTHTRQSQIHTRTDQGGTTHTHTYDLLLRPVSDAVTTLGAAIDSAVLRVETSYDELGRITRIRNYDSPAAGNVVNAVQRQYNAFGQLAKDVQSHTGDVTSDAPAVCYDHIPAIDNCTALLGITYPNGRQIDNDLGPADGTNAWLGRPGNLHDSDTGAPIAHYQYLGRGVIVTTAYPQPGIALTYLQEGGTTRDTGDPYCGLDNFGRIIDHRWITTGNPPSTTPIDLDRHQYAYDPDSQRIWKRNPVSANQTVPRHFDERYNHDALRQLTLRQRGQLSPDAPVMPGTPEQEETWDYDPAGNWKTYAQDNLPDTPSLTTTRTHNPGNEITHINSSPSCLAYDPNGNMTIVPADPAGTQTPYTTQWDAWGRLIRVQGGPDGIDIRHAYDGIHRRTRQIVISGTAPSLDFYYNADWKIIEERAATPVQDKGATTTSTTTYPAIQAQYIYGPRNRNDLILRDADLDGLWTRHYILSDAMLSTTALADAAGVILRRYTYTAFGTPSPLNPDFSPIATPVPLAPDSPRDASSETTPSSTTPDEPPEIPSLQSPPDPYHWNLLFHGEFYDPDTLWSNYGYRYYSPAIGRWLSRDPAGEVDGSNLFSFAHNSPMVEIDYLGGIGIKIHHYDDFLRKIEGIIGIIGAGGAIAWFWGCDLLAVEAKNFLNTKEEKAAWDNYTSGSGQDMSISAEDFYKEILSKSPDWKNKKKCEKGDNWGPETKSFAITDSGKFQSSIGRATVTTTSTCKKGCLEVKSEMSDLYDFDTKPGFPPERGFSAEMKVIIVNLLSPYCSWKSFHIKGTHIHNSGCSDN